MKALQAEIEEIGTVAVDDMEVLRRRIQNDEVPFITVDMSHPVFNGHQDELSLLDKETLAIVVKTYAHDRFLSTSLSRFQDEQFTKLETERKTLILDAFENRSDSLKQCRAEAIKVLSRLD